MANYDFDAPAATCLKSLYILAFMCFFGTLGFAVHNGYRYLRNLKIKSVLVWLFYILTIIICGVHLAYYGILAAMPRRDPFILD